MTINANIDTKMDHSCNWRCCFGYKDPVEKDEPKVTHVIPEPQTAQKSINAMKDLRRVEEGKENEPGVLEYEFDAVHFKMKKTPDPTPVNTPRMEKKDA